VGIAEIFRHAANENNRKDRNVMNYIVLIKQVPDIKNIPKEAWDWEKGILKRALLDNVCNEFDRQALTMAVKMREQQPGKIVTLTMGPPFAEEVLKYALSIEVDEAVLLTDRKLGGADTPATAYPLAQAVRKIESDIFKGDKNYVIVSGMQSVDGDTAQVPPQIAEELKLPHIAYVTNYHTENGNFKFDRITRLGTETVMAASYPYMITVTEWTEPLFPSFSRTRWANGHKIIQWSADAVNCDDARIGLAGSKTNVVKIFSPKEVSKKNVVFENDLNKLVGLINEAFHEKVEAEEKEEAPKYQLPEGKKSSYSGEVWVYAEQEEGQLNSACFELLGKATELAKILGEKVGTVLVGQGVKGLASSLIAQGADKVYVADHALLKDFLPVPYTKVIAEIVEKYKPQQFLFSATPMGRELGPRVAYRTRSGLTADCTGLDIIDFKRGSKEATAILQQTRPALGGNIMASIITQNSTVQMSTARPGVMVALDPDENRKGEVIEYTPQLSESDLGARILASEQRQMTTELKDAVIMVSGGGGLRTKDNFNKLVFPLAESMSKFLGHEAMVGASRLAVESGFIDRSHQVGQTGQTVKPRLYIALGISGAVQHVTGMQNSDIIISVNKDPNAKIFRVSDFGILGNVEEVVPELIKALKANGG
jgi:electron transfer flavoprotein alpha subunit